MNFFFLGKKNRKNAEETKKAVANNDERQFLLKSINLALIVGDWKEAARLSAICQDIYGQFDGNEEVWDECDYGHYMASMYGPLTPPEKSAFLTIVRGEAPEGELEKWHNQITIQKALKKAFENRDLIEMEKILAQGADINWKYRWGGTLWQSIQHAPNSRMYQYLLTRKDCTEAMAFKAKENAELELLARRAG